MAWAAVVGLAFLTLGETTVMAEEPSDTAYACIRVVRQEAGTPAKPKIVLPSGYALHTQANYEVASPGEYYVFLKGPKGTARDVQISWPGVKVRAVIHNDTLLPLRRDGEAVLCDVPVASSSLRAAWPTLEIHTPLDEESLPIRIEHNDPARRAGKYAEGPWVEGQTKAVLNFIIAARQVLRDWGLHRDIRRDKKGTLSLMGSETNNPLHGDWPSHWHLIYYWPLPDGRASSEAPGSQVPHFYLDEKGRITSDNHFVFGRPAETRTVKPGEPIPYTDPDGKVRFVLCIRADGGLDLGPAVGEWTYSIVAGGDDGAFAGSVRVLRRGSPWIRVAVRDDTAAGVLMICVDPLDGAGPPLTETHHYDPLTGRRWASG
jgi:hypothetical protein